MSIFSLIITYLYIYSCYSLPFKQTRKEPSYKITVASSLSSTSSTISPQMEQYKLMSRYFHTTTKKITLDDGRMVKCKIPLFDFEEAQQSPQSSKQKEEQDSPKLTDEQIKSLLLNLKDTCTRYRTNDFLWEFCHEKYIRQYDDEITIRNAGKPKAELFFLGFHESVHPLRYMSVIKEGMGDYQPERDYYDLPIRQEIPNYRYLQTHGRFAKTMNVRSFLSYKQDMLYFVIAYLPADELNDDTIVDLDGSTLGAYRKENKQASITKNIEDKSYIKVERFIDKVLNPYVLLLKKEFPIDISTAHTKIFPYAGENNKKIKDIGATEIVTRSTRALYASKNLIYGHNAFLSDAQIHTSVLITFDNKDIISRVITKILDDQVIMLDEEIGVEGHTKISKIIMLRGRAEMKDIKWTQGKGKIWTMGDIILGNRTSFTKDFIRGDMILLLEINIDGSWTKYALEVLRVIHDSLMIVRTIISTSMYMIGKYVNLEQYALEKALARKLYEDESINYVNTEKPNSFLFFNYEEEIPEEEPLCNPTFYFPDPKSWLMTFEPALLDDKANLMIHLSDTPCSLEGIEINFYKMENVIIMNFDEKSKLWHSPLDTIKYNKVTIWITYEHGILRVGIGNEISLEKQLLSFQVPNQAGLAYYTFNRQFSYNVKLNEIQVVSLPKIARETFELINNLPQTQENTSFIDHYAQGTYCGAANIERRADVEYKCSKSGKFLQIEEIKEPSTCRYHIVVGTSLLCPPETRKIKSQGDLAFKLNCFVQEEQ